MQEVTRYEMQKNEEQKKERTDRQHRFSFDITPKDFARAPTNIGKATSQFKSDVAHSGGVSIAVDGASVEIHNRCTLPIRLESHAINGVATTIAPDSKSIVGNDLYNYDVCFESSEDDGYDAARISMSSLFAIAQQTPIDDIQVKKELAATLLDRRQMDNKFVMQRYRVAINRAMRSQRQFMIDSGIDIRTIREYEDNILNSALRIRFFFDDLKKNSMGRYDATDRGSKIIMSVKHNLSIGVEDRFFDMAIAHELVHLSSSGYRFEKSIVAGVQKEEPFYKKFGNSWHAISRGVHEGFTEITNAVVEGDDVCGENYAFNVYCEEAGKARDIYRRLKERNGEKFANMVLSYFNLGDWDSFLFYLNDGLGMQWGAAMGQLYDIFSQSSGNG